MHYQVAYFAAIKSDRSNKILYASEDMYYLAQLVDTQIVKENKLSGMHIFQADFDKYIDRYMASERMWCILL